MSKEYNAFEVAQLLDVNIETVRRWIRKEELAATQTSRKEGNIITEEALRFFLSKNPKYSVRAKKNGYVCISPVKISKVGKPLTRRQTGTKTGGRERTRQPSYQSTTPAIQKSLRYSDSPRSMILTEAREEPADRTEWEMFVTMKRLQDLVNEQQKEINLLNRKLRSSNEKIGRSANKKR